MGEVATVATNGKLFDRNKNPMLGTAFKVQFYNPDTSSITSASYSDYGHEYILRLSSLFHSGGASLARPDVDDDGLNPADGSGSNDWCRLVWIVTRMTMLLALTIFSGTMATFFMVAFITSEGPILSVACLVPLIAFGLPLVGVGLWSGWRFAKACHMLSEEGGLVTVDNEPYIKYGGNPSERV